MPKLKRAKLKLTNKKKETTNNQPPETQQQPITRMFNRKTKPGETSNQTNQPKPHLPLPPHHTDTNVGKENQKPDRDKPKPDCDIVEGSMYQKPRPENHPN